MKNRRNAGTGMTEGEYAEHQYRDAIKSAENSVNVHTKRMGDGSACFDLSITVEGEIGECIPTTAQNEMQAATAACKLSNVLFEITGDVWSIKAGGR